MRQLFSYTYAYATDGSNGVITVEYPAPPTYKTVTKAANDIAQQSGLEEVHNGVHVDVELVLDRMTARFRKGDGKPIPVQFLGDAFRLTSTKQVVNFAVRPL